MVEISWISVLPPLIAVSLAIWTRKVYLSLLSGIFLGWLIINHWNPLTGTLATGENVLAVFKSSSNTKVIVFCGLVGIFIELIKASGGVEGLILLLSKKGFLKGNKKIQLFSAFTGIAIFIETSISSLIVGTVFQSLYDKKKIPRAKLAYICDSTSAPVNLLIPFNAWGAFIIGLLVIEGIDEPVSFLIASMPFNFYPFFTLLIVFVTILSGRDIGPMKGLKNTGSMAKAGLKQKNKWFKEININPKHSKNNALYMIIPTFLMIILMPVFLFITGKGDLTKGVGATAVFWSVVIAVLAAACIYLFKKILNIKDVLSLFLRGFWKMWPVMALMILAFSIGNVTKELGTGIYLAGIAKTSFSGSLVPVILFIFAAVISFSTGTSWGTYGIMIPISIAIAQSLDININMTVAAVLGGGLFGDHSSPISDTTILASMASGCDHIEHVRTQLPYALTAAALSLFFYFIIGII